MRKAKALSTIPSSSGALYEGATIGRMGLWGMSIAGPNVAVSSGMFGLRARSRELVRNNPWARSGLTTLVSNLIGTGIVPFWHIPDDPALAKQLRGRWDAWTQEADADGRTDFYGLQALAAREVVEAGEALARFRQRRAEDELTVPLQLQVLEPDFLDETYDGLPLENGHYARLGIEFDAIGRRAAYWLRRYHPGDETPMSGMMSYESVPVPAEEVLHVGVPERAGQVRYLPWLSSLILRFYELDLIDDAKLVRDKIQNLLVGFAYDDGSGNGLPGVKRGKSADGQTQMELQSGTIQRVPQGVGKIEWTVPPAVGDSDAAFIKYQLRAVATGMLLTYEQLTGDFSDSNFSSFRGAIAEFRRRIEMIQWQVFVFQFCRPVAIRFLEAGIAAGTLPIGAAEYRANRARYLDIRWRPPRWAYIEPLKDIMAEKLAVRSGFKAREDVVAEMGEDVASVDERIAADNARADSLGLAFDTDSRLVDGSGKAQPEATDPTADETGSGAPEGAEIG